MRDVFGWFGVTKPKESPALTVTLVTLAAAAVVIAVKSAFRRTGRPVPALLDEVDWVVPALVALITLFIRL